MFENAGGKIRKIAIVNFWIVVVVSVILAFVLGFEEEYQEYHIYYYGYGGYTTTEFYAEYFFGFLIGVPLVMYIETLFLVAFGNLVENTQIIKEKTIALQNHSSEDNT